MKQVPLKKIISTRTCMVLAAMGALVFAGRVHGEVYSGPGFYINFGSVNRLVRSPIRERDRKDNILRAAAAGGTGYATKREVERSYNGYESRIGYGGRNLFVTADIHLSFAAGTAEYRSLIAAPTYLQGDAYKYRDIDDPSAGMALGYRFQWANLHTIILMAGARGRSLTTRRTGASIIAMSSTNQLGEIISGRGTARASGPEVGLFYRYYISPIVSLGAGWMGADLRGTWKFRERRLYSPAAISFRRENGAYRIRSWSPRFTVFISPPGIRGLSVFITYERTRARHAEKNVRMITDELFTNPAVFAREAVLRGIGISAMETNRTLRIGATVAIGVLDKPVSAAGAGKPKK